MYGSPACEFLEIFLSGSIIFLVIALECRIILQNI